MLLLIAAVASAQTTTIAEGRVNRPLAGGKPVPVPGQWVVLHRVGSDKAAPLDSVKSGPDGRFRFRYTPSGAADALYFVSVRHDGIAYFSPPLRGSDVRGGDADVIVYDTTSDATHLRIQGRHLVVSAPRDGRREIAEVFEIENEGATTVVPRSATQPLFATRLPAEAESVTVAQGDIGAGAVEFMSDRAEVYAPISPGLRQLVLTFLLPTSAFPLSQPMERDVSVLEILLEEPRATAQGAKLAEMSATRIEGRAFRRFLGQDVPANGVIRIDAPSPTASSQPAMRVLFIVIALLMAASLAAWFFRRGPRVTYSLAGADGAIAELAMLDAQFERSPGDRAAYDARRAELKARIQRELAAEKPAS